MSLVTLLITLLSLFCLDPAAHPHHASTLNAFVPLRTLLLYPYVYFSIFCTILGSPVASSLFCTHFLILFSIWLS